jgi:16S rRNA (cytosine1402-N4)-methyltransferase
MEHISVLIKEVEQGLGLKEGDTVVDATLGLGGHSKIILEKIGKTGKLIAFEQDEDNLKEAKRRLQDFEKQIVYIPDNFRNLKIRLIENKIEEVDKIFFDLGICSTHVDIGERGFSFMKDANLDMRFNRNTGVTASDVVNFYDTERLAKIFREYGEEKSAWRIANAIVDRRKEKVFDSTTDLAEFIKSVYPKVRLKVHPATKVFQALRIEVNDELNALKEALQGAFEMLREGGIIAVLAYHSLEDRIVKKFFKELENPAPKLSEQIFRTHGEPKVQKVFNKPLTPSDTELSQNPRSRSAKLRAYIKLSK